MFYKKILCALLAVLFLSCEHYNNTDDNYSEKISDSDKVILTQLTKEIKSSDHPEDAYYKRGRKYFELGFDSEALSDYNSAAVLGMHDDQFQYELGLVLINCGIYKDALYIAQNGVERDSNNLQMRTLRGISLFWLKDSASACSDLKWVIEKGEKGTMVNDFYKQYCH